MYVALTAKRLRANDTLYSHSSLAAIALIIIYSMDTSRKLSEETGTHNLRVRGKVVRGAHTHTHTEGSRQIQ